MPLWNANESRTIVRQLTKEKSGLSFLGNSQLEEAASVGLGFIVIPSVCVARHSLLDISGRKSSYSDKSVWLVSSFATCKTNALWLARLWGGRRYKIPSVTSREAGSRYVENWQQTRRVISQISFASWCLS